MRRTFCCFEFLCAKKKRTYHLKIYYSITTTERERNKFVNGSEKAKLTFLKLFAKRFTLYYYRRDD